jgi:hypothetical protein
MGSRGVSRLDQGLVSLVRACGAERLEKKVCTTWTDARARSHAGVRGNQLCAGHSRVGAGSDRISIGGRLVGLGDGSMAPSPRVPDSVPHACLGPARPRPSHESPATATEPPPARGCRRPRPSHALTSHPLATMTELDHFAK